MVEAPKPKNSIEAVASAPSGVRAAAIDLALLRSPAVPHDMVAVRRYFQEVIGAGEKKEAPRTLSVGGLRGDQLNQIWASADQLIKRAETMLRLRGARAWTYELSKSADGQAPDERIFDLLFHILENGEHASAHVPSQLNSPAARRISRSHRGRIVKGVQVYEEYLSYAKKAHGDPHDIEELLHAWQAPAYVANPSPPDTQHGNYYSQNRLYSVLGQPSDPEGNQRAEQFFRGHLELEKMIKVEPGVEDRFAALSPEEKIVYIQYLGMSAQNKLVSRSRLFPLINDYHRMSPILAKMEGNEPYPARQKLSERIRERRRRGTEASEGVVSAVQLAPGIPATETPHALPSPEPEEDVNQDELAAARRRLGLDN